MGCFVSTNSSHNHTLSPSSSSSMSNADLTSYQDACQSDPELQSFDTTLQHRTTRVITNLAVEPEPRSLSLNSLRDVTGSLLDMNQQVVNVILACKHDIWDNDHLFSLVEDYFESTLHTLDFCTSLENCLKSARSGLSFLQIAINQYDSGANHLNPINQFNEFKALDLDSLFSDEFFVSFQSVHEKQIEMLNKLQSQRGKVDRKLKATKTRRRLSNVIFVTTFSTVLICSVVAAAVSAPPLLTALAAAVAVPMGLMGKWISSLWKKYENEVKDEREVMSAMQIGSYIVIKDLDNIKALVDKLGADVEGVLPNADFAINEADVEAAGMDMVVDEMRKMVNVFGKTIDDLSDHSDKCVRDTRRARTMILQRIIRHSSESI
ncbi:UPF0496 protein 1-like [Bidens hawaiensis]|uniref:UPF0496 protein 1-like n=1 Tax=Bidens hawaiensis TaxID=980011 RepID=UPI00404B5325